MGETTVFKLPYPEDGDAPNGPAQMKALAEAVETQLLAAVPAGVIFPVGRESAPTGFLLCDGSAVSRTTYARLFSAIGTKFGSGNGSSTFNLPDLRGRVPVGVDGSAGRMATSDAFGNSGGEEKHTLTTSEIPAHTHTEEGWGGFSYWLNKGLALDGVEKALDGPVSKASGSAGSGASHNNMPPYQITQYMIRT